MKLCKYCNKSYPENDFGVALSTPKKIYRRLKCRFCYNSAKNSLRDRYQKWLNDYKIENGCVKCGMKDYRALEFHHLRDKEFTIGYAFANSYGIDRVKEEIKKCVVICANCHRITHYGQAWRRKG